MLASLAALASSHPARLLGHLQLYGDLVSAATAHAMRQLPHRFAHVVLAELKRERLVDQSTTGARGGLGLLVRHVTGIDDIGATLRPVAEKHPYGVLAGGAAAGGTAWLALPRLAAGLIVPSLWSEGRQFVHGMLHGWLNGGVGDRSGGAA